MTGSPIRPFLLLALKRPALWPAMLSAAWAFRPRGWYRRPPFLPLPSRAYMRWRLETAYGDPDAVPPEDELARFITWSAEMRRHMRGQRGGPLWVKVLAVAALAAFAVWVNVSAAQIAGVREAAAAAGYWGLFGVSVVSGFNLVAPVPVALFYPFLIETGFAPLPTLLTIAAGMTGGDFLGYMVGNAARDALGHRLRRVRARLEVWLNALRVRHRLLPYGILFLYAAFAPIPNELVVIPMAFMRCSLAGVMTAVLLGNVIFNSLMASGVTWFVGWWA